MICWYEKGGKRIYEKPQRHFFDTCITYIQMLSSLLEVQVSIEVQKLQNLKLRHKKGERTGKSNSKIYHILSITPKFHQCSDFQLSSSI